MNPRAEINSIYLKYYGLDNSAWHQKVDFYEANLGAIKALNYSERMEVDLDYCMALFEVGKYNRYLDMADPLIENVIIDNIYVYAGKDIFQELLFKKAACLFNLKRFDESNKITLQLIQMDKSNKTYRYLLSKSYYQMYPKWYNINCAIAVVLFLSGLFLFILQLFVIEPFYQTYVDEIALAKYLFFASGVVILIVSEGIQRLRSLMTS